MPKLKVFCATSGFHDSVVAAPSRPAALKAWGAKTDLFSMGVAKQVTDPKIVKKALARPGEVIRLSRAGSEEAPEPRKVTKRPAAKRPSRAKFNAAEDRLAKLDKTQSKKRDTIDRELKALERKRDDLLKRQTKARKAAEAKLEDAREQYEAALDDWSG
jgi:hypothetical protein